MTQMMNPNEKPITEWTKYDMSSMQKLYEIVYTENTEHMSTMGLVETIYALDETAARAIFQKEQPDDDILSVRELKEVYEITYTAYEGDEAIRGCQHFIKAANYYEAWNWQSDNEDIRITRVSRK